MSAPYTGIYTRPMSTGPVEVVSTTVSADTPPRFSLLARDVLKIVKHPTLVAAHGINVNRKLDNVAVRAAWKNPQSGIPVGEFELGWNLRQDVSVLAGFDSKGRKHLDAEITGLVPGFVVTSKNQLVTTETNVDRNACLVGIRYEQPNVNTELSVDVLPQADSEHRAIFSTVVGRNGMFLGGRISVALNPQDTEKQHLVGYDVGGVYRLTAGEVFLVSKQKLGRFDFGFRSAISPATEVAAVMKYDRLFHSTRLRIAAVTQYQDVVVRGSVNTKGKVAASVSVPLGLAMGSVVFATNAKNSLASDAKVGVQLTL